MVKTRSKKIEEESRDLPQTSKASPGDGSKNVKKRTSSRQNSVSSVKNDGKKLKSTGNLKNPENLTQTKKTGKIVKEENTKISLEQAESSKRKLKNGNSTDSNQKKHLSNEKLANKNQLSPRKVQIPSKCKKSDSESIHEENSVNEDESDDSDEWEEVEPATSTNITISATETKAPIEIALQAPNPEDEERRREIEKAIKRIRRDRRDKLHQITLLSFVAHLKSISDQVDSKLVKNLCLSVVPVSFLDLKPKKLNNEAVSKFLKWFRSEFVVAPQELLPETCTQWKSILVRSLYNRTVGNCKEMATLFMAICKSMNWPVRLVIALSTVSFLTLQVKKESKLKKSDSEEEGKSNDTKSVVKKSVKTLKKFANTNQNVTTSSEKMASDCKDHDYWIEIYCDSKETWIPVSISKGFINETETIAKNCSQPLLYALALSEDCSIKDVTKRYNADVSVKSLKRLRLKDDWFSEMLEMDFLKSKLKLRDRLEDVQFKKKMEDLPFPKKIADFKHHPIFVLKRNLLKFEIIYPLNTEPVSLFRNEPVFLRENVRTLHTKETWLKEARSIKTGQEPMKKVKGRPKPGAAKVEQQGDRMIPVFGQWQTEPYKPPVAKDGLVPRNQFGNVDLFQPSMLPRGTVHLKAEFYPGLLQIAKKLNIDCAQAMTGWDFHGGFSHPTFDGVVVCKENERVLLEAWEETQAHAAEKEISQKSKRALKNWAKLVKSLLEMRKLQRKFGPKEKIVNKDQSEPTSSKAGDVQNTQPTWEKHRAEFTFQGVQGSFGEN